MAQEFTINSANIESKINQLLPSQGGFGAGVDFSASTMVIPIVDLTETAEGSPLRQDLQTAFSFNNTTNIQVNNTTTTVVNTTGYFRIFGSVNQIANSNCQFVLNDGATDKILINYNNGTGQFSGTMFDFIVFISSGDLIKVTADASGFMSISSRQVATISGDLV